MEKLYVTAINGTHRDAGDRSFKSVFETLIPTVITAVAFLACFVAVRSKFPNIYMPRTYFRTIPEKDRTPVTRPGSRTWYSDILWLDDKFVLRHHSLDAYLFLRFFRIIILICLFGCCLTWPILFPVNATGGGTAKELNKITFSNAVGKKRLYAHVVVAWVFVGFILLLVTRERLFCIGLRQANLTTDRTASRLSSRVVLFLSAPPASRKPGNMKRYFGPHAKRCWPVSDLSRVQSLVDNRNEGVYNLETAEVALARDISNRTQKGQTGLFTTTSTTVNEETANGETDHAPSPSLRPKSRTIPLIGKQVDTIDWQLEKLGGIVDDLQHAREHMSKANPTKTGAVFIEFETQMAAHEAYQAVRHYSPLTLQPRYIGMQPKEVLWENVTMKPSTRILYGYVSSAILVALIVFWSIPVSIIGTISHISSLTETFKFLRFLNKLPDSIIGLIEGFLPAYLLSEVVSYVPKFIRRLSRLSGAATTADAEIRTQHWYFAFQFIILFLITTFSSGVAEVAQQISDRPKEIFSLLATNLPTASNFYLSYIIIQGITASSNNLLNYSDALEYSLLDRFWDSTPRQKYDRLSFMRGMMWGTQYPKFANLTVIAIAYSCIAPLILGFATIGFIFFYLSFRYNIVYTKMSKIDTKGDSYALALQHLMVGVYLLELCLLGLVSARKASGPSTLMFILLGVTILFHATVNKYLSPLEANMPIDVFSGGMDEQQEQDDAVEEGESSRLLGSDQQGRTQASLIDSLASANLPSILLDPLASFLSPRLLPSPTDLRPWLFDDRSPDDGSAEHTESEAEKAYVAPAMTSKTPPVWLPHDQNGVSKWAIGKNKAAGLETTDEAAMLDQNGHIRWDKNDLSKAPIFKAPKTW